MAPIFATGDYAITKVEFWKNWDEEVDGDDTEVICKVIKNARGLQHLSNVNSSCFQELKTVFRLHVICWLQFQKYFSCLSYLQTEK